jgi:hypothetical protein
VFGHRVICGRLSRRRKENRVIRVSLTVSTFLERRGTNLFMLLQVLGTLEALSALFACMGFEGDMDSNVTCNVVSFGGLGGTVSPAASQAQIICRFAPNVFLTQMVLHYQLQLVR